MTPRRIPPCFHGRARVKTLTAIDLFSGCGGLTLGLKKAGFAVLGAVDSDSVAVETYHMNHPEVAVWEGDIRRLTVKAVMQELHLEPGELDLVAGCPPCEGFSTLRTLNGGREVVDRRNELIFEFLRFVRVLRPKAVMLENVPGLADDERFVRFCTALKQLGYEPQFKVLNAADFGVPQRRRRLILVAGLGRRLTLAEPEANRRTVRDAIGMLATAGSSGDVLHDLPERRSTRVREIIIQIPRNGGSRLSLPDAHRLGCHARCDGFKDVYGRMAWDSVAPTVTSGCFNPSKGRFLHPEEDRCITMREAALLQAFPDDYAFSLRRGKTHVATMIGNALPPEFIYRHASELAVHLLRSSGSEMSKPTQELERSSSR